MSAARLRIGNNRVRRIPDVRILGKAKTRRHDAYDIQCFAGHLHPFAKRVGLVAEVPRGIRIADNRRAGSAVLCFLSAEFASQKRRHAKNAKKPRANLRGVRIFRRRARCRPRGDRCIPRAIVGHRLKRRALVVPIVIVRCGYLALARVRFPKRCQRHDAIRIGVRKGFQQHRAHHAEHRRVRADSQREDQHGHHREARVLQQHPHRKPQILQQRLHCRNPATLPINLFCLCNSAKLDQRVPPRFVRGHS
jgi:hypothetical protein